MNQLHLKRVPIINAFYGNIIVPKNGKDGVDGKDGAPGIDGKDGCNGVDGKDGKQGLQGKQGLRGLQGKQGPQGKTGPKGKDGKDGKPGKDGKQGIQGKLGPIGPPGPKGDVGPQGEVGPSPEHRWVGTALQFKQPDGKWGKQVNLKGDRGVGGGGGGDSFTGLFGTQIEKLEFIGKGTGATKTTTVIVGGATLAEAFGVGDEVYLQWVLPNYINRDIAPKFVGHFFSLSSGVGQTVSWEISILQDTDDTNYGTDTPTILTIENVPLPDNANEAVAGELYLPDQFIVEPVEAVHIKIKRIASTNDPADVALEHIAIEYSY